MGELRDRTLTSGEPTNWQRSDRSNGTCTELAPLCLTLEEDELSRCGRPAMTSKRHSGRRCEVHQAQYRTIYLRYKDASRRVDEMQRIDSIPSRAEIKRYNNSDMIKRKIEHVYKYLELVQIERVGRDIHGRRFFLTRDDPHLRRSEYLEREVRRSSEAFLALKERARCLENYRLRWHGRDSSGIRSDTNAQASSGNSTGDNTSTSAVASAAFYRGTIFQASQTELDLTKSATEELTTEDERLEGSEVDLDLIVTDIKTAMDESTELLYASLDYFFSK